MPEIYFNLRQMSEAPMLNPEAVIGARTIDKDGFSEPIIYSDGQYHYYYFDSPEKSIQSYDSLKDAAEDIKNEKKQNVEIYTDPIIYFDMIRTVQPSLMNCTLLVDGEKPGKEDIQLSDTNSVFIDTGKDWIFLKYDQDFTFSWVPFTDENYTLLGKTLFSAEDALRKIDSMPVYIFTDTKGAQSFFSDIGDAPDLQVHYFLNFSKLHHLV